MHQTNKRRDWIDQKQQHHASRSELAAPGFEAAQYLKHVFARETHDDIQRKHCHRYSLKDVVEVRGEQ
jgi:hypothetical protein